MKNLEKLCLRSHIMDPDIATEIKIVIFLNSKKDKYKFHLDNTFFNFASFVSFHNAWLFQQTRTQLSTSISLCSTFLREYYKTPRITGYLDKSLSNRNDSNLSMCLPLHFPLNHALEYRRSYWDDLVQIFPVKTERRLSSTAFDAFEWSRTAGRSH